ncbi:MAG: tetratricopeptide repeat protein [Planctomycetota bacterium]
MRVGILVFAGLLLLAALCGCSGSGAVTRVGIGSLGGLMQGRTRVSEEDEARSQFAAANSRLAEERGDVQSAVAMYREAIRINPENSDALWRLGLLHIRQNEFDLATDAFERAVDLDPQNALLCADFGYHLYLSGDLKRAEKYLRGAVRGAPNDQRAGNNLGLVLAAQGRDEESLAAFLDAGCTEAEARANLAFAQAMRLDVSAAGESLKASMALDPTSTRVISAQQQLAAVDERTCSEGVIRSGYATMEPGVREER